MLNINQEVKTPQTEGSNPPTTETPKEKPPFQPKLVRSLEDVADIVGYREKVWFYQTMYKETDKYGTKYLKDYYCYNCKGPFLVNKVINYAYDRESGSKPILFHKKFLETKKVKDR